MRILLSNYLSDDTPADINSISIAGAFSRKTFDKYCALKSSSLDAAALERVQPEIYRALATESDGVLFLKVHDAWRKSDRDEPVFPADCTLGVIYIIRSVLDVAASAAHHWGKSIPDTVERLCREKFSLAASRKNLQFGLPQPLGSWSGHVGSWLDQSGLPCLLVRYEDLKADTTSVLADVIRFCGFSPDERKLQAAVEQSRFEKLREKEASSGFKEHSPQAPGRFFRKGLVGSWREELTPDLVRQLIDTHGDTMRRFGYLDSRGNPVF